MLRNGSPLKSNTSDEIYGTLNSFGLCSLSSRPKNANTPAGDRSFTSNVAGITASPKPNGKEVVRVGFGLAFPHQLSNSRTRLWCSGFASAALKQNFPAGGFPDAELPCVLPPVDFVLPPCGDDVPWA